MKLSPQRLDWLLALPLIAGITMIAETGNARETAVDIGPWAQGAALLILGVIISLGVAAMSAIDRRCSEEYVFQVMANAALVAFASTALINMIWAMAALAFNLPQTSGQNITGVLMISWVLGYYWFRWRGIAS